MSACSNGPKLVCAGCGAETSVFAPLCEDCMDGVASAAYVPRAHVASRDCWCQPEPDAVCPDVWIHRYEQ